MPELKVPEEAGNDLDEKHTGEETVEADACSKKREAARTRAVPKRKKPRMSRPATSSDSDSDPDAGSDSPGCGEDSDGNPFFMVDSIVDERVVGGDKEFLVLFAPRAQWPEPEWTPSANMGDCASALEDWERKKIRAQ
jgi:hypothetical protein